jgi:hypothetical protein
VSQAGQRFPKILTPVNGAFEFANIVQRLRKTINLIVVHAGEKATNFIYNKKMASQAAPRGRNTRPLSISGVIAVARDTLSRSVFTGTTGIRLSAFKA